MLLRWFAFLLCCLLLPASHADPLPPEQVPDPLKPWVGWVLDGQDDRACPSLYHAAERQCAWPGTLVLELTDRGGKFTQQWEVYGKSTLRLPGDAQHWPQAVRQDGKALTVLERDGHPSITLPAGSYTISGEFFWDSLPESLPVAPATGIVQLSINGTAVSAPEFNDGNLWLGSTPPGSSADHLEMQVFRKVEDGHPMQVTTHLRLRVVGKQRQVELAPVLLDGFIPLRLDSPLPARMGQDGKLQVQLRPGEWSIELVGRALGNQTGLSLPSSAAPWPQEEVWVFAADTTVRQVQVEGANSIDPSQTNLPPAWTSLPAYRMVQGGTLQLVEQHRGMAHTPAQLSLTRQLWLDFDGGGYTLQDQLQGTLVQEARLEVVPEVQLGRVSLDGVAQPITRLGEDQPYGVGVRQRNLNLEAESRIAGHGSLPVSGWQHTLQQVQTTLYLPPGWLLFAVFGTDNLPRTWLNQWNLLDLFLVLLVVVATGRLYGWQWGGIAALALALTWHQMDAPRYVWLNLLAVVALLRVLPNGNAGLGRWLQRYKWLSLLILALVILPFAIHTVRNALYPQLAAQTILASTWDASNHAGHPMEKMLPPLPEPAPALAPTSPEPATQESAAQAVPPERMKGYYSPPPAAAIGGKGNVNLQQLDPNSMIQTGPGLPDWRGEPVELAWSGVITPEERTRLWLVPPWAHSLLRVLGVLAVLAFALRLAVAELPIMRGWQGWHRLFRSSPMLIMLSLGWLAAAVPAPVQAEATATPPPELLQTLKERLLRAPDCLPQCAQFENMHLQAQADNLQLRLRIHAATHVAVPLPGSQGTWLPQTVLANGTATHALRRDEGQHLWVVLPPGLHDVLLQGNLAARSQLTLPLPLKPHRVTWEGEGWQISGIRDNGVPEAQLQLNRTAVPTDDLGQGNNSLPAFVRIERRLDLGLDWHVTTTVTRLSDGNTPITLNIPLLPGEQPLSDAFTVQAGTIQANLKPQQTRLEWTSRLPHATEFTLTASKDAAWIEEWQVVASPVWHVEATGLPPNAYEEVQQQGLLRWKPWPEETLTLRVSRPQGAPGQTVTVLSSKAVVEVGKRARDVELALTLQSSRGTQHSLSLPTDAVVHSLTVDGVKQAIQQQQGKVTLPLSPTKQTAVLEWQEAGAMPLLYRFPAIDLGLPSVNNEFRLKLPQDRWVLWGNGPLLGPAVLFWGVLAVLLVLAILLGHSGLTPLKSWQWFLLGVGLSQSDASLIVLVGGWLLALAWRGRRTLADWQASHVKLLQVGLAVLTFLAVTGLFGAVAKGLLGLPEMQIAGNGSSAAELVWYQDRSGDTLPQPNVVSVPLLYYRLLMLAWALWLAVALLGWLRWGWAAANHGGLWRSEPPQQTPPSSPSAATPPDAPQTY